MASKAASAQYRNPCPVCGAAPGEPCRTLRTMRVTDTHLDRIRTQSTHLLHLTPNQEEGSTP